MAQVLGLVSIPSDSVRAEPPFPVVAQPSLPDDLDVLHGDFRLDRKSPSVHISFVGTGARIDAGAVRFLEIGETDLSTQAGDHIWLRISNNSIWTISFRTYGTYTGPSPEMVEVSEGKFTFALPDGAEAGVSYSVRKENGEYLPSGSHSAILSWLPSGRSVIFSVDRKHLKKGRVVFVDFQYQWEADESYSYNREPIHRTQFHSYRLPD